LYYAPPTLFRALDIASYIVGLTLAVNLGVVLWVVRSRCGVANLVVVRSRCVQPQCGAFNLFFVLSLVQLDCQEWPASVRPAEPSPIRPPELVTRCANRLSAPFGR